MSLCPMQCTGTIIQMFVIPVKPEATAGMSEGFPVVN